MDERTADASGPENDMAYQPPSRTRFYRDKRNGKFMGVCAGIADYTGFDVTLVRIVLARGRLPEQRLDPAVLFHRRHGCARQAARAGHDGRGGAALLAGRPRIAARDRPRHPQSRLRDIDRRLADIESYVTTENRSLAREIEQLR